MYIHIHMYIYVYVCMYMYIYINIYVNICRGKKLNVGKKLNEEPRNKIVFFLGSLLKDAGYDIGYVHIDTCTRVCNAGPFICEYVT